MKPRFLLILLSLLLAGCGPEQPSAADLEKTAAAIVQTSVARTQTALPSVTPPPATLTLTPEVTLLAPTLTPPPPTLPPMITPDATQVERWREYQTELAKGILPMEPVETVLCEWDILAHYGQEVYVWAVCASPRGDDTRPAIINLEADGSIQNVEIPKRGSGEIDKLFPEAVRAKFGLYIGDSIFNGRLREIYRHIEYGRTHLTEPPSVVLLATPVTNPTP